MKSEFYILINVIKYLLQQVLLLIINTYQLFVSPFLGKNCIFYPTCSCYAKIVIKKYSLLKASLLIIWRILRCNPLSKNRIDLP
ncbi:MAG TPA: membrane protein insertion efficiency factor YidD [Candidatus Megaira endosymbiont of Hartmannula sinica]|nr:membrane protein insertion efficiency factor YidD [Candidatus Megaera endosymbiont of Hartmannula sinica]